MAQARPDGLMTVGTVRGKEAQLTYDPEDDGGSLKIHVSGSEDEIITNRSIIAVITNHNGEEECNEAIQKILVLSSINSSNPESPLKDYRFEEMHATSLPQKFIDANLVSPRIASLSSRCDSELLYVVVSIGSGTGQAQQYFDNVVKPAFTASGIHEYGYYVHTTSSSTSIAEFTKALILPRANEGQHQTILLLSGDGGVADTLNVLLSSSRSPKYVKPVLSLVAMGTGNALANSTGLNRDLTRGLRHFYRGEPHPLPTFTATFSPGSELLVDEGRSVEPLGESNAVYGAVVCSWALHASLVADSDTTAYRKHGTARFQMAAKELLAPSDGSAPHAYKGRITLSKRNTTGEQTQEVLEAKEYMYLLVALVSNLEEKFIISPRSKPLDGELRLLHFPSVSPPEVLKILGLAFQGGRHVEDPAVGYDVIEGMRIDFDEADGRWRRVCVDGKIIRVAEGGWVELKKNSPAADILDVVANLEA